MKTQENVGVSCIRLQRMRGNSFNKIFMDLLTFLLESRTEQRTAGMGKGIGGVYLPLQCTGKYNLSM